MGPSQMEENMDDGMEAGFIQGFRGASSSICWFTAYYV